MSAGSPRVPYWSRLLSPVRAVVILNPCSSSSAGTVQCRAPALTPRAAYGKAIRVRVPLKRGSERNTTALNTTLRLTLPPAHFFSFPLRKNSSKTLYYSLLFQFISPLCSLPDFSHPLRLIPFNPSLPLGSSLTFCLSTLLINADTESFSLQVTQICCFVISVNSKRLQGVTDFHFPHAL